MVRRNIKIKQGKVVEKKGTMGNKKSIKLCEFDTFFII